MRPSLLRDVSGSAYLALLISIVIMGLTLTLAAKQLSTVMTRAKEADLLARGLEIQNALEAYAVSVQKARVTPNQTYPSTLEELTRLPKPFLRRVYTDPMTNGEWDYLRDERGHIRGVKSRSGKAPFKQRDFPAAVGHFQGLGHYSDWVFPLRVCNPARDHVPCRGPLPFRRASPALRDPAVLGSHLPTLHQRQARASMLRRPLRADVRFR